MTVDPHPFPCLSHKDIVTGDLLNRWEDQISNRVACTLEVLSHWQFSSCMAGLNNGAFMPSKPCLCCLSCFSTVLNTTMVVSLWARTSSSKPSCALTNVNYIFGLTSHPPPDGHYHPYTANGDWLLPLSRPNPVYGQSLQFFLNLINLSSCSLSLALGEESWAVTSSSLIFLLQV